MSMGFLGEIKIMSFNFPPKGWAFCNGNLLPIAQNQALYGLLGTTYGGDGNTTFALPNLQARVPMHQGNNFTMGQVTGEYGHSLDVNEMPAHYHSMNVFTTGPIRGFTGRVPGIQGNRPAVAEAGPIGSPTPIPIWGTGTNNLAFSPTAIAPAGGSGPTGAAVPHDNLQPYLTLNICICLQGVWPSQN
jgi:microcystin-dependent protein